MNLLLWDFVSIAGVGGALGWPHGQPFQRDLGAQGSGPARKEHVDLREFCDSDA